MKKYIIFLLVCCSACQESKKTDKVETGKTIENNAESLKLCFLSTGKEIKRENKILRDSTVLKLTIKDGKVTGIYNWLPAEKDSRRGTLSGKKNEDLIIGEYTFSQEGKQETQPVHIQLRKNSASITTNKDKQGEMTLEVRKIGCPE